MKDIELKDLCGEHVLTGVDRCSQRIEEYDWKDSEVLNFTLDGKTYTACEDPDDGYRSNMRYLRVSEKPTTNTFAPVRVVCKMRENDEYAIHDVLEVVDIETGQPVLEVGTEDANDYYPTWVARFMPENMACNRQDGR